MPSSAAQHAAASTGDSARVQVELGVGQRIEGLNVAPSTDQSSVLVSSVDDGSQAYGVVKAGFKLVQINGMDLSSLDFTAVSVCVCVLAQL